MSETVNQEIDQAIETTEKTFTQAEVDAIVSDRLKRDRAKYADYETLKEKAGKFDQMEEESKTELQKAIERGNALQNELDSLKSENALRALRTQIAEETGVPVKLLTGATEDECREQAKAIVAYAKPLGYPQVKDAGEVQHISVSTRDKFKDWFESNINH